MILYTLWTIIGTFKAGYTNETRVSFERLQVNDFLPGEQIRSFSFWLGGNA